MMESMTREVQIESICRASFPRLTAILHAYTEKVINGITKKSSLRQKETLPSFYGFNKHKHTRRRYEKTIKKKERPNKQISCCFVGCIILLSITPST